MITELSIKNHATFDNTGILMKPERFNLIFGFNGTGKTTISRILATPNISLESSIRWADSYSYDVLVYNRDFVESHFSENARIKGIFTIGASTDEAQRKITELEDHQVLIVKDIEHREKAIKALNANKRSLDHSIINQCWDLKSKYLEDLQEVFSGFHGSKEKFKQQIFSAYEESKPSRSFDDIKADILNYFRGATEALPTPPLINTAGIVQLENQFEQFKKVIVGKNDIDLAKMYDHLGNADWVSKGIPYFKQNDGVCPFCQETPNDNLFQTKLESYFDQSYNDQVNRIEEFSHKYLSAIDDLKKFMDNLVAENYTFIDNEAVKNAFALPIEIANTNHQKIKEKLQEPSKKIELTPISDALFKIKELIGTAVKNTTNFNADLENLALKRLKIKDETWIFLANEIRKTIDDYYSKNRKLQNELNSLDTEIKSLNTKASSASSEIAELILSLTGTEKSITLINDLLLKIGFNNFSITNAQEKGYYKITRQDGSDVKRSLSEGERTFITFLYFYNLVNGGTSADTLSAKKIVFIDDPISSLDSNILFHVSSLVNKLIVESSKDKNNVAQVFVSTHNVYFHKEIAQKINRLKKSLIGYWIVKKQAGVSKLIKEESNTIRTSYELLWNEIRVAVHDPATSVTPNTLRRILETYFTTWGPTDRLQELEEQLDPDDKIVYNSLLNWAHDSSHNIYDDFHITNDAEVAKQYLNVFKSIFFKLGHEGHYNMMIRDSQE